MILMMVLFYYMWSSDNYLLVAPIVPIWCSNYSCFV